MSFTKQKYYTSAVIAGLAAFAVYFCMYAFRKPFTVAKYEDLDLFGIDYKVVLIICQVIGYAISKFFGIKFISELRAGQRATYIIGCIAVAGLALLGFALTPAPYNAVFLLINGLPLGLIWGLVFSYLEGRQATEIMAAILSSAFILASGMVKSVGKWMMQEFNVSEFWMPVLTGTLFFVPLLLFVLILDNTPNPTAKDVALRNLREPMTRHDRRVLFRSLAPGLIVLVLLYMLITAFRDLRDNFSVEVWEDLGVVDNASVFTRSEIPVTLAVLLLFALFFLIKNNYRAFKGMQILICVGLVMIGVVNLLFQLQIITSPMLWTILIGTGLYTAYFPYNSMLFERLIATFRCKGNAGFLIYVADAFGYLASILVLIYKEFLYTDISYLQFIIQMGYVISIVGLLAFGFNALYFRNKFKSKSSVHPEVIQIPAPI